MGSRNAIFALQLKHMREWPPPLKQPRLRGGCRLQPASASGVPGYKSTCSYSPHLVLNAPNPLRSLALSLPNGVAPTDGIALPYLP